MRVLVTGASGFAGQHLVDQLLDTEAEVVGGVLDGAPPAPGTLTAEQIARVAWAALDVTDDASVAALVARHRPAQVYHLAGQSSVGQSFAQPLATWEVNATGTLRLLHALQGTRPEGAAPGVGPPRVLVVSSAEVYGAVPEHEQPIAESRVPSPTTPYGASKAAAEMVSLQMAAHRELEVIVARSFNHVGPGQDQRFALPSMALQLARMQRGAKAPVLRVGNLSAHRDFLDVRDVARAYLTLMRRGESGAVYNVGAGEALSLAEVVEMLVELSGTGARIEVDPDRIRPVDIPLLLADARRLRALGWAPEIPLSRTLRDLLLSPAR